MNGCVGGLFYRIGKLVELFYHFVEFFLTYTGNKLFLGEAVKTAQVFFCKNARFLSVESEIEDHKIQKCLRHIGGKKLETVILIGMIASQFAIKLNYRHRILKPTVVRRAVLIDLIIVFFKKLHFFTS